jgi:hypothetical protein
MGWLNRKNLEVAAAVGLIGWYLMIPPPRQIDSKLQINYTAPIEKWVQLRLFDSRSECEAARSAYAKNPPGGIADMLSSKAEERAVMQAARCIAASDPRIAEQSSAARSVRPLASNPQRAHPRRQRARIHAEQFRGATPARDFPAGVFQSGHDVLAFQAN